MRLVAANLTSIRRRQIIQPQTEHDEITDITNRIAPSPPGWDNVASDLVVAFQDFDGFFSAKKEHDYDSSAVEHVLSSGVSSGYYRAWVGCLTSAYQKAYVHAAALNDGSVIQRPSIYIEDAP